jgi:uncharacterized iron-regulated membrane protein
MQPHAPIHLRTLAMRLHRWVALALGAWFALLGLTGGVLVWHAELDRALNPAWFAPRAPCAEHSDTPVADALAVFARATHGATATQVMAPAAAGAAFTVWEKPPADGLRRQHFVDPHCGAYLGKRAWGAARIDRAHVVPALYELHRALLLREAGHVAVGFAGLALLFVAVTGLWTAWPRHPTREAWKRTLTLKRGAGMHRRFYDLHRATGAWLALFLLLMSVTGAYLCFPKQARALVAMALPTSPAEMRKPADTREVPLAPDVLVQRAQTLWRDAQWSRLQLPGNASGAWDVRLLQGAEVRADTGDTRVRLDHAGRVVDRRDPLRGPAGDRLIAWLFPLHSGEALGLVGRIAWSGFGLAPALLFATGLWLWVRRRRRVAASGHALSASHFAPP